MFFIFAVAVMDDDTCICGVHTRILFLYVFAPLSVCVIAWLYAI